MMLRVACCQPTLEESLKKAKNSTLLAKRNLLHDARHKAALSRPTNNNTESARDTSKNRRHAILSLADQQRAEKRTPQTETSDNGTECTQTTMHCTNLVAREELAAVERAARTQRKRFVLDLGQRDRHLRRRKREQRESKCRQKHNWKQSDARSARARE